jgi:uncharacterized protein
LCPFFRCIITRKSLRAYVQDYLKEEIIAEGVTRNFPAFTRFTDIVGFCNGEMINFSSIARDTGIDAKTVREYFQILSDTMIGTLINPYSRKADRNIIGKTPKFYFFDVGLSQYLAKTRIEEERGSVFGRAFEHFIFMELTAYIAYSDLDSPLRYWRTLEGGEVDFVLADGAVAIEVKSSGNASAQNLKGLVHYVNSYTPRRAIVVTNEAVRRKIGVIEFIPWRDFLEDLWAGKILADE